MIVKEWVDGGGFLNQGWRELLCFKAYGVAPGTSPLKMMMRPVMRQVALSLVSVLLVFLSACSSKEVEEVRQVDIKGFLGKTEAEVIEMLGEPTGTGKPLPSFENYPEEIVLREVIPAPERRFWLQQELEPPLGWLEITFSEEGFCDSVSGFLLAGYDSPQALLEAVGLGAADVRPITSEQRLKQLGLKPQFRSTNKAYEIPDLGVVSVSGWVGLRAHPWVHFKLFAAEHWMLQ